MQLLSSLNPLRVFKKIASGIRNLLPNISLFKQKPRELIHEEHRAEQKKLLDRHRQDRDTEDLALIYKQSDELKYSSKDATKIMSEIIGESSLRETGDTEAPTEKFKTTRTERMNKSAELIYKAYINNLTEIHSNAINKVKALNQSNSSPEDYVNVFKALIKDSIAFTDNLQTLVTEDLLKSDYANDVNLARTFLTNKELSRLVSDQTLTALNQAYSEIASNVAFKVIEDPQTGKKQQFAEAINNLIHKSDTKNLIRNLYYASKVGTLSAPLVEAFKSTIQYDNTDDDKAMHVKLLTARILNEAIHGALLYNLDDSGNYDFQDTTSFNEDYVLDVFNDLAGNIFNRFKIQRKELQEDTGAIKAFEYREMELRGFLFDKSRAEAELNKKTEAMSENNILSRFGFNQLEEQEILEQTFNSDEINFTTNYVGKFEEKQQINQQEPIAPFKIVDYLRNSEGFFKHFERIMLENALLAALDVISTDAGLKPKDEKFAEQDLYRNVPWFKTFYHQNKLYYESLIGPTNKDSNIARVLDEMTNIGHAMRNRPDRAGMFQVDDFAKRYDVAEYMDKLSDIVGHMTKTTQMSLVLDLYSNLFSSTDVIPDSVLNPNEKVIFSKGLKYLRDIATFDFNKKAKDEFEYTPNKKEVEKKYEEICSQIAKTGFLSLMVPLTLKVLNHSIEAKTDEAVLASQVLFYLIKYLSKYTNKIDSLHARKKMFKFFMNDEKVNKLRNVLAPSFFNKLMLRVAGLDQNKKPEGSYAIKEGLNTSEEDRYRHGLIKAFCIDLWSKFKDIEQRKVDELDRLGPNGPILTVPWNDNISNITIEDLLKVTKEVEDTINANPRGKAYYEQIRREKFTDNKPLLPSLDKAMIKVIDKDPRVIKFAKEHSSEYIPSLLRFMFRIGAGVTKAGKEGTIDRLQKYRNQQGEYVFLDSDESSIKLLKDLFLRISIISRLMQDSTKSNFTLSARDAIKVMGSDKYQMSNEEIEIVKNRVRQNGDFFRSKIVLIKDKAYEGAQAAFPEQEKILANIDRFAKVFGLEIENLTEEEYRNRPIAEQGVTAANDNRAPERRNTSYSLAA